METIIRFSNVSFVFGHDHHILDEVSFSIRRGMKVALMGQNGAGKSTLFKLITGEMKTESGQISIEKGATIATAFQVMPTTDKSLTVEQYFQKYYIGEIHEVRRKMSAVLDVVHLKAPSDKIISSFSGGQQARLLLAAALIQEPDVLLLDEPTNNLDHTGIYHLTDFLMNYQKSCVVISHDAEFLNAFTQGVLYLDSHTKKVEQYAGDYNDVVAEIAARIEKQNRQNALMAREIQEKKDNANFFAQKGGKMRNVAKKMYEKVEQLESEKVDVRKEDKTIRPFTIPVQEGIESDVLKLNSYTVIHDHRPVEKKANIFLSRGEHLQIVGPNGMGKSTLIEAIAHGTAPGATMQAGIRVGYYRQDFSMLNFEETVNESLVNAITASGEPLNEEHYRAVAAGFLISSHLIKTKIGHLSEGQKGLVAFARLVLQKPGLLILDEPTNHINFRHLPRIAAALDAYKGAMILVSHVADFVAQIKIHKILDLEK
jgi:ATPase subunit of ABC transporter with duplicated ATPase domains